MVPKWKRLNYVITFVYNFVVFTFLFLQLREKNLRRTECNRDYILYIMGLGCHN